jgi:HEAT repeat protein
MRTQFVVVLTVVFTVVFTTVVSAGSWKDTVSQAKYDLVEKNLLIGLASDNLGLRASCAYMLGEIGSTKAVIPLMAMLHCEGCEGARIMAGLSLYKIGTPMSIYAVKQAARFDDSERVRKACGRFYREYVKVAQSKQESSVDVSFNR